MTRIGHVLPALCMLLVTAGPALPGVAVGDAEAHVTAGQGARLVAVTDTSVRIPLARGGWFIRVPSVAAGHTRQALRVACEHRPPATLSIGPRRLHRERRRMRDDEPPQ
jgi:hypothetical protein